jgi:ADP-heptose:LPS heptosyltransferase
MGDVAMTVPVLLGLLRTYPLLKITVLTRGFFAPIFSQLPRVTVHEVDTKGKHKGLIGLWNLFKELEKRQIHRVADLHNVLRSSLLKFFFGLNPVPFVQIDKGRKEKKALTAARNKQFLPLKSTHQRYADVFAQLGLPITPALMGTLPKRELSAKASGLLASRKGKLIGLAPFAAHSGKMYPLSLMKEVVAHLSRTHTLILFGGGSQEGEQLEEWAAQFENCINTADRVGFSEELDLISQLDLMLAMDSGNAHLAAMFGVPTVTVWGVTHPYAGFLPFGQDMDNALLADREKYPLIPTSVYGNKLPEGYERAMETIAPQTIVNKVQLLLAARPVS